jgi:ribosomal protein RSM22 (predicted rRNA methylase)
LIKERRLRVLDLGCGPGTLFAGLLDYFLQHGTQAGITLDLTGLDRDPGNCSAARALLDAFLAKAPKAPEVRSIRFLTGEVRSLDRRALVSDHDGFDCILAGNLINELQGGALADLADRITALLKPAGMLIILDPGTRQSFRNLLMLRQELLTRHGMYLVATCLQEGTCPLQNCAEAWCHEKLFWTPPLLVSLIDRRTGFTKHKGVKFSYLAITRDKQDLPTHKDLWRVTSYVIRNKGEERLYVCNGRERLLLRRLTRITNPESSDFSCSERGDIVSIKAAARHTDFMNIGPETVFQKIS